LRCAPEPSSEIDQALKEIRDLGLEAEGWSGLQPHATAASDQPGKFKYPASP